MATNHLSKPELKKQFIDVFKKNGGLIYKTCEIVCIAPNTYYNWLEKDPEFKQQCQEALEYNIDYVESKLKKAIDSDELAAIFFYLKCKAKHRGYVEKQYIEQKSENLNYEVTLEEASSPVLRQKAIEYLAELNRIRDERNNK